MRVIIVGGPRTGKTTLAPTLGLPVRSTDDLKDLPWSTASDRVAEWISAPGPWVIEGASAVRGLRKWLVTYEGKPCERVIHLHRPRESTTAQQDTMARGITTILGSIRDELERRGVAITVGAP